MNLAAAIEAAAAFAAPFEGLHKVGADGLIRPYRCPANVLTIGYGHTGADVTPSMVWGHDDALDALEEDVGAAVAAALKLCPCLGDEGNEDRLTAIADFVFNLGAGRLQASTLRKRINAGDWEGAKREIVKWVYGGGRKLPGLVLRRAAEARLLG